MIADKKIYVFYKNQKVISSLEESINYKTENKYKWCANELLEVSRSLTSGGSIIVCGKGLTLKIENQNDLETWIRCVFDKENFHGFDMFAKEWV